MRLVVNPRDEIAFLRVINEPKRGIGAKTVEKLMALANIRNESLLDTISDEEVIAGLPAKARDSVRQMAETINLCRSEKENLRISDIYDNLLVRTGYMKEKSILNEPATLEEFLEKVATDGDADKYETESGKVTLMTLHSAKGLEFPVVFMPGMEDGLFPGHRSIDSEEKLEEERRLCYVGMTRARERLFLTSAEYRVLYGNGDFTRESIFMRELDSRLLDSAGDAVYVPRRSDNNRLGISTGKSDGFNDPEYRPYDPLQYAKKAVKSNAMLGDKEFSEGDKANLDRGSFLRQEKRP